HKRNLPGPEGIGLASAAGSIEHARPIPAAEREQFGRDGYLILRGAAERFAGGVVAEGSGGKPAAAQRPTGSCRSKHADQPAHGGGQLAHPIVVPGLAGRGREKDAEGGRGHTAATAPRRRTRAGPASPRG